MHPRDRVLAAEAADELGDDGRVGNLADDAKQRRLLGRLLGVGVFQQLAGVQTCLLRSQDAHDLPFRHVGLLEQVVEHGRRVVLGAAHRPHDGRHGPLIAVLEPFRHDGEGPRVEHAAERAYESGGLLLVRVRQRIDDARDGRRPELGQLVQGLARVRFGGIPGGLDLGDQAFGAEVA